LIVRFHTSQKRHLKHVLGLFSVSEAEEAADLASESVFTLLLTLRPDDDRDKQKWFLKSFHHEATGLAELDPVIKSYLYDQHQVSFIRRADHDMPVGARLFSEARLLVGKQ
jgi:hypothetical protein